MQPALTTYKHYHSTFTINLTSINSDATCINYVQALPQHVYNQSNKYQLRCNLYWLCTSTATACFQSIKQVSTPMQPTLTTYKHYHSMFTINPTSINSNATWINYVQAFNPSSIYSDATCINYIQALPQHIYNQSNKYQLRCNLHKLRTSTTTAHSQSIRQVSTTMQHAWTMYKHYHSTFTITPTSINSN